MSGFIAETMIACVVSAAMDAPSITPERTYVGVKRPLMVQVASPRTVGVTRLALMKHDGTLIGKPVEVRPGRIDLADVLPDLWSIRRASYVQVLDHHEPVGSALVLQPMLSRLVPVSEQATRANGSPYTRIVGWRHELDDTEEIDREAELEALNDRRVFSGFRVYAECDVVLHTSQGRVRLAMRPDEAPNTVWNFLELVRGGFYDGVIFHRIVPLTAAGDPFVIQAGDPTAGTSRDHTRAVQGAGSAGQWLPIEPSRVPHDFGVTSMARADHPDSAGSQFFICLSRAGTARLDGQYAAFGYAVDGAETIVTIADTELADVSTGRAVSPPVIERAERVPAPPRIPGEGRPDRRVTHEPPQPVEPRHPGRVPR
jgi:peptidyl-prolyl cis-trans isomerase B (cyclophilin B)